MHKGTGKAQTIIFHEADISFIVLSWHQQLQKKKKVLHYILILLIYTEWWSVRRRSNWKACIIWWCGNLVQGLPIDYCFLIFSFAHFSSFPSWLSWRIGKALGWIQWIMRRSLVVERVFFSIHFLLQLALVATNLLFMGYGDILAQCELSCEGYVVCRRNQQK